MYVNFKGKKITRQMILNVMRDFEDAYPNTKDYDNWLDKRNYKYAVYYNGKLYPPKRILSNASGIDVLEFGGGEQTNRVFRKLGFEVGLKDKFLSG